MLGSILGVSFQQIQKYESGTNRNAVATLVRAAEALDAPLTYFLNGIGPQHRPPVQFIVDAWDAKTAQALAAIEDRKVRAAPHTLVRALSAD
jgi:transcriptional regulator with XRE-family HTH domain